jgi:hypothetical protein
VLRGLVAALSPSALTRRVGESCAGAAEGLPSIWLTAEPISIILRGTLDADTSTRLMAFRALEAWLAAAERAVRAASSSGAAGVEGAAGARGAIRAALPRLVTPILANWEHPLRRLALMMSEVFDALVSTSVAARGEAAGSGAGGGAAAGEAVDEASLLRLVLAQPTESPVRYVAISRLAKMPLLPPLEPGARGGVAGLLVARPSFLAEALSTLSRPTEAASLPVSAITSTINAARQDCEVAAGLLPGQGGTSTSTWIRRGLAPPGEAGAAAIRLRMSPLARPDASTIAALGARIAHAGLGALLQPWLSPG